MLYYSDRNYGCRFMEIMLHGFRALIMENEKIRIMLILDKGAEIVEFLYKETDTDFIWRSPLGLSCIKKQHYARRDEQDITDVYTGGWFEAFPNVGVPCSYKGALLPYYGEVMYLPWEYTVIKDEPEEIWLRLFVRTTKTPFYLQKELTLKSNTASLFIQESVKNVGRETIHYQWGQHPNLGKPFLQGGCRINMPVGFIRILSANEHSGLKKDQEGEWPFVVGNDGKKVDLSVTRQEESGFNIVAEINDLKGNWTEIENYSMGLGVRFEWDAGTYPHNTLWHVCNGDMGYPRYGDTYVLGFVVRNDKIWTLDASQREGTAPVLEPGSEKRTHFEMSVRKILK